MASSRYEQIVLAFSTDLNSRCSGTLFNVLSEDGSQYYKLMMKSRTSLEFEFKIRRSLPAENLKMDENSIDFCDNTRHIVNIERTIKNKILYRIDGRRIVEVDYGDKLNDFFYKPYNFYVGKTKNVDDAFDGCLSGVKFHLFSSVGDMKTVQPIKQGIRSSNDSSEFVATYSVFYSDFPVR